MGPRHLSASPLYPVGAGAGAAGGAGARGLCPRQQWFRQPRSRSQKKPCRIPPVAGRPALQALRANTAKARRCVRDPASAVPQPPRPQDALSTRSRVCSLYFGSDSEALLHKFLLQPAPPSASSPPSPPRLQSHSPGDRGERRNLINLQNARDLLIYYYNCSSAHDTSPALGVGTEQLLASAPDRLQALMTFRCLQTVILSSE